MNLLVPLLNQLSRCVRYLLECKAKGVLICPAWKSASFWPLLFTDMVNAVTAVTDFRIIVLLFACAQNLEFGVFGNDKLKQSSVFFSFMEIHKIIQQQNYNNVLKCLKHIGFPTSTKFQLAIQY